MAVESIQHPTAFPCEECDCTDGIAPEKRWKLKGRPSTDVCFRNATTHRSRLLVSLVPHYRRGFLYRAGGIQDQPGIYVAAMMFLTSYLDDN